MRWTRLLPVLLSSSLSSSNISPASSSAAAAVSSRAEPRLYDESLPFGSLEGDEEAGEAQLTIQQFINKLKQIRKNKHLGKNTKNSPPRSKGVRTPVYVHSRKPTPTNLLRPQAKNIPAPVLKSPSKPPPSSSSSRSPNKVPKQKLKFPPKVVSKQENIKIPKSKPTKVKSSTDRQKTKSVSKPSPVVAPPVKRKQKQPKFSSPKGHKTSKVQKENDDEDDFFRQALESHEHHVHQHDHLHAHKAFHKHKESHEHAHAHNNDHVHNHKHTHNHVHNHIHKHNEQHEHQAEHQHTEKHHHKHIEYIDAGGWKKRSDPAGEDNLVARSDESNPTFEPFEDDVSADKLEERSGMIVDQKNVDVENNLKAYLRKYIEFYKSVADSDIDTADERNDYHDGHISMTNKKNAFPDTTFVLADDNDYDHQTSNNFYHPEAKEDNTEILPNYEKDAAMEDPEDAGLMTFDDYMIALSDQFPELNDDDDEPDYDQYGQYGQDLQDLQWSPLLQELQLAFYDAEPDWQPELQVELGSTRH